MRLFVAVDVPGDVKDAIETDVVESLRERLDGARWTRPEGRHLTLAFIGEVEDERVPDIAAAVGDAASSHRSFGAAFDEVGGFPNLRRPRVLWVGVGAGKPELVALAADVQGALVPLGFEKEDRPFHPHLTLARFQRPRVIDAPDDVVVPASAFIVDEVVLFRSQLHPQGARYTVLDAFTLGR